MIQEQSIPIVESWKSQTRTVDSIQLTQAKIVWSSIFAEPQGSNIDDH